MIPRDLKPGALVRCAIAELVGLVDRFILIRNGDGSDYQGPDDVDLVVNGSQVGDYPPASIRRAL